MNRKTPYAAYALLILTAAALTGASQIQTIAFQPQSRVWIAGTSSVRSYTCEAGELRGSVVTSTGESDLDLVRTPEQVVSGDVTVPVQKLDCRNGTMNSHLRKALKAEANPTIRLRLASVAPNSSGRARLTGSLAIAGQERPFVVDATVVSAEGGGVRVQGSKQIVMTEFGVAPPSLMLGTMKVRDPVIINFDVILRP